VNARRKDGVTALSIATSYRRNEIKEFLLQRGAAQ
jgi:hypothetical protein